MTGTKTCWTWKGPRHRLRERKNKRPPPPASKPPSLPHLSPHNNNSNNSHDSNSQLLPSTHNSPSNHNRRGRHAPSPPIPLGTLGRPLNQWRFPGLQCGRGRSDADLPSQQARLKGKVMSIISVLSWMPWRQLSHHGAGVNFRAPHSSKPLPFRVLGCCGMFQILCAYHLLFYNYYI